MDTRQRRSWLFAAGAAGAAVIVFCAWWAISGSSRTPLQHMTGPQRAAPHAATEAAKAPVATPAATTTAQAVPISVSTCPQQPAVPVSTAQADGAFALEAALEAKPLPSSSAFLAVGREAAQQGRARDAEVAFIAACRV